MLTANQFAHEVLTPSVLDRLSDYDGNIFGLVCSICIETNYRLPNEPLIIATDLCLKTEKQLLTLHHILKSYFMVEGDELVLKLWKIYSTPSQGRC